MTRIGTKPAPIGASRTGIVDREGGGLESPTLGGGCGAILAEEDMAAA